MRFAGKIKSHPICRHRFSISYPGLNRLFDCNSTFQPIPCHFISFEWRSPFSESRYFISIFLWMDPTFSDRTRVEFVIGKHRITIVRLDNLYGPDWPLIGSKFDHRFKLASLSCSIERWKRKINQWPGRVSDFSVQMISSTRGWWREWWPRKWHSANFHTVSE
jgi:hypothetical protein